MAEERMQDTWFVSVAYRDGQGNEVFGRRGILDLPHSMTAFDASGCALGVEIRDIIAPIGTPNVPREIHAVIWGKRREGLAEGRYQACGALAKYDVERGVFMRPMPWIDDKAREEVAPNEGAVFHPIDW